MENTTDENKGTPENEQASENTGSVQFRQFFKELLDIRPETDRDATIKDVNADISFRGHNAWILVFSIFVASIGLNLNSPSVIIGAMLISPLMGPIVGVGLSIAINDIDTLKRSMTNLGVMIVLSILTAWLYFFLSPMKQATPELIARTYPTVLDVFLAIFGGLAFAVGKTKKGTMMSVILGVAIATALMPPLCTVGYGLAVGNWDFFWGALYLFSINSVFIALSTFVVAKFLRFPMVQYANSKKRRKIARIATAVAVLVMIPSVILFVKLLNKQLFVANSEEFVEEIVRQEGTEVLKFTHDYASETITVYLIGALVPREKIQDWNIELQKRVNIKNAELKIVQGAQMEDSDNELTEEFKAEFLEQIYVKNQETIESKDERIAFLENELTKYGTAVIPFEKLSREAKINYADLEEMSFAYSIKTNFEQIDTLPVFTVKWKKDLSASARDREIKKLAEWLKLRLTLDTLNVQTLN